MSRDDFVADAPHRPRLHRQRPTSRHLVAQRTVAPSMTSPTSPADACSPTAALHCRRIYRRRRVAPRTTQLQPTRRTVDDSTAADASHRRRLIARCHCTVRASSTVVDARPSSPPEIGSPLHRKFTVRLTSCDAVDVSHSLDVSGRYSTDIQSVCHSASRPPTALSILIVRCRDEERRVATS